MNRPITDFDERMVDAAGRELTWRGKWAYVDVANTALVPVLPARYPRTYYKMSQIDLYLDRARTQYRGALDRLADL